jgi:hypothetical protein
MKTRRHSQPPGSLGDLSPEVVDILLTGDSPADHFLKFDLDCRENWGYLRRLWRENRKALLAEWKRRGGEGDPWGAQYDPDEAA